MNNTTYEEYLEEFGELTYSNVGISMLPMLKQGRDLFTVKKKTAERCRKYDVVLYRRPPDQYVLHRVVRVREKDYVICGDNCYNLEYGITDDDIIGVLTSFIHKGRKITADNKLYRLYARIWCSLFRIRRILMKIKFRLKRTEK